MAEETNSLRAAVDRILGTTPGGSGSTATSAPDTRATPAPVFPNYTSSDSAGTGGGPVQLATPTPYNWNPVLTTESAISNEGLPAVSEADQQLADIRAQTAALQAQTAQLIGTPATSPTPSTPSAPTSYSVGGALDTSGPPGYPTAATNVSGGYAGSATPPSSSYSGVGRLTTPSSFAGGGTSAAYAPSANPANPSAMTTYKAVPTTYYTGGYAPAYTGKAV